MKPIFKTIVGSQAYGTNTPTSDVDIKGVYIQPLKEVLGFSYREQVNVSKDETYYEIKRYLDLAMSANPTMLELLYMPDECVLDTSIEWEFIKQHRDIFLTKNCRNSFGGYAVQQIRKAKGLNKKMNWEKEKIERKTVLDFCYISVAGKAMKLAKYLEVNQLEAKYCGMVKLDHMADCYAMYHDHVAQYGEQANHRFKREGEVMTLGFRGIESLDGNQLVLSSVPKYTIPCEGTIYFNKSEYSSHCADYKSYEIWLKERNTQRYIDSQEHGQKIDGKNLLHCRRLLDMAIEIATEGKVIVRRPNAPELLKIRRGEVKLDQLIAKAEEDILLLDELYSKSTLPDCVDITKVEDILITTRGL